MSDNTLTYDLESAAKELREASSLLETMKAGGVTIDLSIASQYVSRKLTPAEQADLNGIALAYLERRDREARERLVVLGMSPKVLGFKS